MAVRYKQLSMSRAWLLGWLLLGACAGETTALTTLKSYREALRAQAAEDVWRLSDVSSRNAMGIPQIERWMQKNPRLVVEAERRVSRAIDSEGQTSVQLLKESGQWKVVDGGLLIPRTDSPEGALETYFFAATGHLGLLRRIMPTKDQQRYKSDYRLGTWLYSMRERIFTARDLIGPLQSGRAEVKGDTAVVKYGEDKACELIREEAEWRVVRID